MTRYFYADPLAAAWMQKHFGMKFEYVESYSDDSWMEPIDLDRMMKIAGRYGLDSYQLEKLYIHPDSLPLLEVNGSTDLTHNGLSNAVDAKPVPKDQNRIILRNGIPFHWPEQEQ